MNPDKNNQDSSVELPAPQYEDQPAPTANVETEGLENQGEQSMAAELPQSAPPPVPVTNDPISSDGLAQLLPSDPAAMSTTVPQVADDSDLIEKEWVEKAKAIVAQTTDDPYVQNKELSKFKADYMKKRYNKEIPTDG